MEVFPLPGKNDSSVRLERLSNLLDEHLITSGHATRVDRCVYGAVSQALGRLQPPDGWLLLGLLSTNFYGVVGSGSVRPLYVWVGWKAVRLLSEACCA
jgi:hypothetical protein